MLHHVADRAAGADFQNPRHGPRPAQFVGGAADRRRAAPERLEHCPVATRLEGERGGLEHFDEPGDVRNGLVGKRVIVAEDARQAAIAELVGERALGEHQHLGMLGSEIPAGSLERSEEHTSELQSLMRISYAVFCLKKKKNYNTSITQFSLD